RGGSEAEPTEEGWRSGWRRTGSSVSWPVYPADPTMLTYGICIVCTKSLNYASSGKKPFLRGLPLDQRHAQREAPEPRHRPLGVVEEHRRTGGAGQARVTLEQLDEALAIGALERDERDEVVVD